MICVEYRSYWERKAWTRFGTSNNLTYALEIKEACRSHHPGCECRIREEVPAPLQGVEEEQNLQELCLI